MGVDSFSRDLLLDVKKHISPQASSLIIRALLEWADCFLWVGVGKAFTGRVGVVFTLDSQPGERCIEFLYCRHLSVDTTLDGSLTPVQNGRLEIWEGE